ncbi:MAG: glutamate---cysteine ligase / carboxylate-amine ligase, partial [Thermoleophilaceae bacterium]|nr:glutamate---cysteine ligase / carboxylate-amine ligase [Thermoleophilaceae bacterium]
MEHRFTGPSYTLGVEEELMIVDAETLDLVNSIETLLAEVPETTGDVKPELMESVLEIATTPVANTREAGL